MANQKIEVHGNASTSVGENVRDFCNNLTRSLSKELLRNGDLANEQAASQQQLGRLLDRPDFRALLDLHKLVSTHLLNNSQPASNNASCLVDETDREIRERSDLQLPASIVETTANDERHSASMVFKELIHLLANTHFRAVVNAHDRVARKEYEPSLPDIPYEVDEDDGCCVKIVRLVKNDEPLGATIKVKEDTGALVIARIMHGGVADRSGCIQVGDRVIEVNGINVAGKQPNDVVKLLSTTSNGTVTFKLVPAVYCVGNPRDGSCSGGNISSPEDHLRLRALFDYLPESDQFNPCPEAGVAFTKGNVLMVVDCTDPYWWQAKLDSDPTGRVGLVPSKQLQEKRIACQKQQQSPCSEKSSLSGGRRNSGSSRKVRKIMYETRAADDFEREELKTYEEVARLYPRAGVCRPIVLIGAPGVGRNELKRRLILMAPDRFGGTVPHTSRNPKENETPGVEYHFASRLQMEDWAREGRFIEFGEYKGNLYGTTVDSVRSVLASGRVCVLNPHPQAIRILRSPELKPFIVHVKPPTLSLLKATRQTQRARSTFDPAYSRSFSDDELERMVQSARRLERLYGAYFDDVLINDNLETAFESLLESVKLLETHAQWVPISWVR